MTERTRGARKWVALIVMLLVGEGSGVAAQVASVDANEGFGDEDVSGYDAPAETSPAPRLGVRIGGSSSRGRAIPAVYSIRRGDTLWDITGHFYGSPWEWPRVWSYNPEVTNPHWIYPNDTLRLLPEGQVQAELPQQGLAVSDGARFRDDTVLLRDEGYLDEEALRTSGRIVGSPEEQMLLSNYDDVYVEFEEGAEVRTGMELTVFRPIRSAEREPDETGELVRIYGGVRLQSYDPERRLGRAQITDSLDPIERGYRVANVARRFELLPPRSNDRDVRAEVVATLMQNQLVGDYQLVFVNVGSEQGVQVGNRFFVVREGDVWRENLTSSEELAGASEPDSDEPAEYPQEVVAEGRVVTVRPSTAALMVTRALAAVKVGDAAEMREGY